MSDSFWRHRKPRVPVVPDAMPLLSKGRHDAPDDGACLMEYVSIIVGEPFTDRPRTAHPLLATVARAVNDRLGDGPRQDLLTLAPEIVGTRSAGYDVDPVLTWIVASAAARARGDSPQARAVSEAARRRARRNSSDTPLRQLATRVTAREYRARVSLQVATMIADDIAPSGSAALIEVLRKATATCRGWCKVKPTYNRDLMAPGR